MGPCLLGVSRPIGAVRQPYTFLYYRPSETFTGATRVSGAPPAGREEVTACRVHWKPLGLPGTETPPAAFGSRVPISAPVINLTLHLHTVIQRGLLVSWCSVWLQSLLCFAPQIPQPASWAHCTPSPPPGLIAPPAHLLGSSHPQPASWAHRTPSPPPRLIASVYSWRV